MNPGDTLAPEILTPLADGANAAERLRGILGKRTRALESHMEKLEELPAQTRQGVARVIAMHRQAIEETRKLEKAACALLNILKEAGELSALVIGEIEGGKIDG